MSTRCISWR